MSIGERVREIRIAQGISMDDLAHAIGFNVSNLSRLETGTKKQFTEEMLYSLARALSVKVTDLFSANSPQGVANNEDISAALKKKGFKLFPLSIHSSTSGDTYQSGDLFDNVKAIEYKQEYGLSLFGGRQSSAIRIATMRGDTMSPTIEPGDLVFVDVTVNSFVNDGVYVFSKSNKIFLRRIQAMPDHYAVISDNATYNEWALKPEDAEDCAIYGKVLISQSQSVKRHE